MRKQPKAKKSTRIFIVFLCCGLLINIMEELSQSSFAFTINQFFTLSRKSLSAFRSVQGTRGRIDCKLWTDRCSSPLHDQLPWQGLLWFFESVALNIKMPDDRYLAKCILGTKILNINISYMKFLAVSLRLAKY